MSIGVGSKRETGFTLVELAIALMIIGLLIGGVLKGIELVQNARVTQSVRQVTENITAMTSFVSAYHKLPGDLAMPSRFIPNCQASPCSDAGNEDGFLRTAAEQFNFWPHMQKTGFLTSIDGEALTADRASPVSPLGGNIAAVYKAPADYPLHPYKAYNYFAYHLVAGNAPIIRSVDAAKIDLKMDDAVPYTGLVRAENAGGSNCVITGDIYNENDETELCNFFVIMR